MDHKPLLQERPPAYNLEAGQGDYACGPHGYGAIPAAPPPPPYPYLVTGGPVTNFPRRRLPRDTHPPSQGLQHPQPDRHPLSCQLYRGRRRLSCLQGWGAGGLLHLPGHLPGHHPLPLWVHLLFCLEEATMPQLWSHLRLKGTPGPAFLHPALFF
ncbi:membrane protein BRI3 isoform X2 [Homo sapiens]|uniref:membrane protein BRI3 isoform X2 n=1 Tax=Homo sapiens TaxID=9606 RepID=UPI001FB11B14|nr:membrane protein BRI3 isoform X2 [Homo sapiens]XP_054213735.1 membrane protein BRI3 isoform X2 [Homo sapiens]